jgi:hypothetical protein
MIKSRVMEGFNSKRVKFMKGNGKMGNNME